MSDGPHKSLPMKPRWKKAAEIADNSNYDVGVVCEQVTFAVSQDLIRGVPKKVQEELRKVLEGGEQKNLFQNRSAETMRHLEGIRSLAPGNSLVNDMIDSAQRLVSQGIQAVNSVSQVVKDAVKIHLGSIARQIGEHYSRESTYKRAYKVRNRIEQSISGVPVDGIAHNFANRKPMSTKRPPQKQTRLNDGVPLK